MIADPHSKTCSAILGAANFSSASVLEVGCGDGRLTHGLARCSPSPARYVALEPDLSRLRAAAAKFITADFVSGSGQTLPFGDDSFDVVLFSLSLHHHARPEAALAEALRVVRPGGVVVAAEPLADCEYSRLVAMVDDETGDLARAQQALAALSCRTIEPDVAYDVIFESRADLLAHLGERSGREPGPEIGRRVDAFLGKRAGANPVIARDELRLHLLEKASHG